MLNDYEKERLPSELHGKAAMLRGWVGCVGLRPGQQLAVEFGGGPSCYLVVSEFVADAEGQQRGVAVHQSVKVDLASLTGLNLTQQMAPHLKRLLLKLAEHEIEEWTTVQKEHVWNAHRGRKDELDSYDSWLARVLRGAGACLLLLCAATAQHSWRTTLDAIKQVETGSGSGIGVKGDGGRAAGPLQIHRIYHTDAAERDRALTSYQRCLTDRAYSERVVRAYMRRYAPAAAARLKAGTGTLADVERVSRIHNGGPRGHRKQATQKYWLRVRANL